MIDRDRLKSLWTQNRPLSWLLLVVAVSLAIRLPWALLAHVTQTSDFAGYDSLAWKWLSTGDFMDARRTPGYPAFLAAIYAIAGHEVRVAQVLQALLGATTSGLVVLVARRVVAGRTAVVAGLLHAVWPTSVVYIAVLASENLATPLLLGSILAVSSRPGSPRRRVGQVVLGGLLFALLVLVRPAALFFGPGLLVIALLGAREWRRRLGLGVAFSTAALLAVSPWLIRNHLRGFGGTTLSTTGGGNLWMGNNDRARDGGFDNASLEAADTVVGSRRDEDLRAAAIEWIRSHPGTYLGLCRVRLAILFGTAADPFAARYLWPTERNDALWDVRAPAARSASDGPAEIASAEASAGTRSASRALRRRNTGVLTWIRIVVAPLLLVAFVLSLVRWRSYAVIVLPLVGYLAMLTATFVQPRFREMSEPLLLIPAAALLGDMVRGSSELPPARGRWLKIALVVAAIGLCAVAHRAGWDKSWYVL